MGLKLNSNRAEFGILFFYLRNKKKEANQSKKKIVSIRKGFSKIRYFQKRAKWSILDKKRIKEITK